MLTKHRNVRGFTLVEIAIVLVVIGLLVGMAMKGKELIETARLKAEVVKVQKIETAFQVYKTKYDRLPGQRNTDYPESNQAVFQDLTSEGLLKEADFVSNLTASKGKYWFFVGCSPSNVGQGDTETYTLSSELKTDQICMYLADVNPKDIGALTGAPGLMRTSSQMVCIIETVMDNGNISTGNGKKTVTGITGWTNGATFDNTLKAPCADADAYNGSGVWYAYRIY